jgi:hypothetical protein
VAASKAPGVTFIESYGLRRLQEKSGSMEVLPGVMSMLEILRQSEENQPDCPRLLKMTRW